MVCCFRKARLVLQNQKYFVSFFLSTTAGSVFCEVVVMYVYRVAVGTSILVQFETVL